MAIDETATAIFDKSLNRRPNFFSSRCEVALRMGTAADTGENKAETTVAKTVRMSGLERENLGGGHYGFMHLNSLKLKNRTEKPV